MLADASGQEWYGERKGGGFGWKLLGTTDRASKVTVPNEGVKQHARLTRLLNLWDFFKDLERVLRGGLRPYPINGTVFYPGQVGGPWISPWGNSTDPTPGDFERYLRLTAGCVEKCTVVAQMILPPPLSPSRPIACARGLSFSLSHTRSLVQIETLDAFSAAVAVKIEPEDSAAIGQPPAAVFPPDDLHSAAPGARQESPITFQTPPSPQQVFQNSKILRVARGSRGCGLLTAHYVRLVPRSIRAQL